MSETLALQRQIFALLDPTLTHLGYELVAVEFLRLAGRMTLRVSIDKPGGVGVQDCTLVSHALSPLLDVEDPIPAAYFLEVSSPGIDRPLQRPQDFQRFAGYRVKLRLAPGPGRRRYTGELLGLEGELVQIEVDGRTFKVLWEQVENAHLVLTLAQYRDLAEAPSPNPPDETPGESYDRQ